MVECDVCGRTFDNTRSLGSHKAAGHDKPWMNEDTLRQEYLENGRSSYDLAEEWGCDSKTIRNWIHKYGIDTRTPGHYQEKPYVAFKTSEQGYERWMVSKKPDRGKSLQVHRLAAVAWFGLDAVVGNHVHHINGVKWDNRPSNLEMVAPDEHIRLHQKAGDIPIGPDAQAMGGYDPSFLEGVPNEDRYKGMADDYEELQNSL